MNTTKESRMPYIGLTVLTILFGIISCFLCTDALGKVINLSAVIIMSGVICKGIGNPLRPKDSGLRMLSLLISDLQNAQKKTKEIIDNPMSDILDSFDTTELFESETLSAAFHDFRKEYDRLAQSGRDFYFCDIADYINMEVLEEAAHSSFNNLVGGMMTGFGILGTFIGLTFGIRNFNTSAAEILDSINILMEGIKVAFLTSIYGMIFSLIFNWFYHSRLAEAEKAMEAFLQTFYVAVPRPDNEGFTRMIHYEERQTASMEQFAEDISLSLTKHIGEAFMPVLSQIDLTMKNQAVQLPQAVSEAIGESVVPTLQGIQENIGQLADQIAETQNQNMGKIAEEFVAHMDAAMGSQLEHLGESIQKLCEWQETASENMKNIADRVCETGEKLGTINEDLQASIHAFEGYLTHLDEMQASLSERYDTLLQNFSQLSQHAEDQNAAFEVMLENEKQSLDNIRQLSQITTEQIERLKEVFQAQQEQVSVFYQEQRESLEGVQEKLLQNLTEQQKLLSDTLSKQAETAASAIETQYKHTTDAMSAQAKQVEDGINQISSLITQKREEEQIALDEQLAALEDYIQDQKTVVSETQQKLTKSIAEQQKQLSDALSEQADRSAAAIEEQSKRTVEAQKTMAESLKTQEEMLEESLTQQAEHITATLNAQSALLKQDIAKVDELQKALALNMTNASNSMNRSASAMTEASNDLTNNLDSAMERTYRQIDKQLAEVVRHLSGTISEIRSTTEKVPHIVQMSMEQSQQQTNRYLQSVADSQRKLSESVTSVVNRLDRSYNNRRGV